MTVTAQNNKIISMNRTQDIRRGFTLIELLTVIALMTILLTLIFKPLVDVFNLTSRAGTQIEAQGAARDTMREVTTTLSDAAYIYDNSSNPINIWVPTAGGGQAAMPTAYAMAEYVRPARQFDQSTKLSADPTTGDPMYAAGAPAGQTGYALPLTAGRTLGRLFIGLIINKAVADTSSAKLGRTAQNGMPSVPYLNEFENTNDREYANVSTEGVDNRYTLYKAEAQTFIPDPNAAANPSYIPNLKLFHSLDQTGKIVDISTAIDANGVKYTTSVQLHDPNFFYDNSPAGGKDPNAGGAVWAVPGAVATGAGGKFTIADNWRAVASTVLLPKKVDAIALNRDAVTNAVLYYAPGVNFAGSDTINNPIQNNDVAHVRPLITFSPYYVENDPGTPASVENAGNEVSLPAAVTYQTQYSHWDTPYRVQVFRAPDATSDPLGQAALQYYEMDPATGNILLNKNVAPGSQDMPGTGVVAGPVIDPATGVWTGAGATPYNSADFFAYSVDPRAGAINFAFPWSVLVHDTNNRPLAQRYSPQEINDPIDTLVAPNFGKYGKRYVQLGYISDKIWNGALLMPAGLKSPLDPTIFGTVPGTLPRISIVPGSERIFGPDQLPGPHYGYRIQYTRVSASADDPGPNQYQIYYNDQPNAADAIANDPQDPRVGMGLVIFDSNPDTTSLTNIDPATENAVPPAPGSGPSTSYRPHSLPQEKYDPVMMKDVGSDPVEITYSFQMNRPNDVVKADYLTRELMNVAINIRYYDPRSARPQETNLTSQVKVRNLQR